MPLRVHGLYADVQAFGHELGGQALAKVELDERAVLVREACEQAADQGRAFTHQRALARVGRGRAQILGFAQRRAARFATSTTQEVVRGVAGEQPEPSAQLVAASWVEAAQLDLVVGQQLHAERGVDLAHVFLRYDAAEARRDAT